MALAMSITTLCITKSILPFSSVILNMACYGTLHEPISFVLNFTPMSLMDFLYYQVLLRASNLLRDTVNISWQGGILY